MVTRTLISVALMSLLWGSSEACAPLPIGQSRFPGWIIRSYPNPAHSALRMDVISMGVPSVVEIFNIRGELQRRYSYGVIPLGQYKLDLDLRGLGTGIYYVRYRDQLGYLSTGVSRIAILK